MSPKAKSCLTELFIEEYVSWKAVKFIKFSLHNFTLKDYTSEITLEIMGIYVILLPHPKRLQNNRKIETHTLIL